MRGVDLPHIIRNALTVTASFNYNLHLLGYDYVDIFIKVPSSGGATATFDAKVQEAIARAATTAWVDVASAAITQVTSGSSFPVTDVITLNAAQIRSEQMRLVVTVANTPSFAGVEISYQGRMA